MTIQEIERPKRNNGRHYSPTEVDVQAIEALRLKILGRRDVEIAEVLGLSKVTVAKRIQHAIAKHGQQTAAEHREIAKQRYEVAIQALTPGVAQQDPESIRLWLDATAKYAKLVGAEAPVQAQVEVTMVTEQEKQLRDLLAQAERDEKVRESVIVEGEVVDV